MVERVEPGGWLLSHLRELGMKGPAEQGSAKATGGSGARKGEGLLINGEILPALQQAARVIVTQGLLSLPESLEVHTEVAQELSAEVSLRRGRSVKMSSVRGIVLMHATGCLTKKGSWGPRGLNHGRRRQRLNASSRSSMGLRSCPLRSAAWRRHPGGGPLSLQRPMPPCSTPRGRTAVGDWEGSHHHWVLTRPREASGSQPPFIEYGI